MSNLLLIFASVTQTLSLPTGLLSSLCFVESKHNLTAVVKNDGGTPSIGVCQVKLATAKMLGFKGNEKELKKPIVNIYYAGLYLSKQINRYKDVTKGIAAYNSGSYITNNSGKTVNHKYVRKVLLAWSQNK